MTRDHHHQLKMQKQTNHLLLIVEVMQLHQQLSRFVEHQVRKEMDLFVVIEVILSLCFVIERVGN